MTRFSEDIVDDSVNIFHVINEGQMHHGRTIIDVLVRTSLSDSGVIIFRNSALANVGSEFVSANSFSGLNYQVLSFWGLVFQVLFLKRRDNAVFVFHSMNARFFTLYALLKFLGISLPELVWVCWGEGVKDKRGGVRGSGLNMLQSFVYRKLSRIVALTSPDKDALLNVFGCDPSRVLVLPYPKTLKFDVENEKVLFKKMGVKRKNVLIGHSAASENDHVKWLKLLSEFPQKSNISVFMFLNYSASADYIEYVQSQAEEAFPEECLVIYRDFLDRDEYFRVFEGLNFYLSSCRRQFGLAAIYSSIMNGATLYLLSESTNARWMDYIGIKYRTVSEIENGCELKSLDFSDLVDNARRLKDFFDEKASVEAWKRILVSAC